MNDIFSGVQLNQPASPTTKTMGKSNSGITVSNNNNNNNGAMLDSAKTTTPASDFVLEDVPHLSDYIPYLPVTLSLSLSFCSRESIDAYAWLARKQNIIK